MAESHCEVDIIPTKESSQHFDVLDWDSALFGFTVARVRALASADDLPYVAAQMRQRGILLAYYTVAAAETTVPRALLIKVGGRLVDTRVTFAAALPTPVRSQNLRRRATSSGQFRIIEYGAAAAGPSLVRLARESGAFSRFRRDRRIPSGVFEAIYDAWIRRSVRHEIADEVLVAKDRRRIVGLVTVLANGNRGEIGLLSVDSTARGRGVGSALVTAAHASMLRLGCTHACVATQRANRGACALYESSGYVVERLERVYHLWL